MEFGGVRRHQDHVSDVLWLGKAGWGIRELISLRRVNGVPEAAIEVRSGRVIEAAMGQQDIAVLQAGRHPAGDREEQETMAGAEDRYPGMGSVAGQ